MTSGRPPVSDAELTDQTNTALAELAGEYHLTVEQHRFLSQWSDETVRRAWSERDDIPTDVIVSSLHDEADTTILTNLLGNRAVTVPIPTRLFDIPKVRLRAAAHVYGAGDVSGIDAAQRAFRRLLETGWVGFDDEYGAIANPKLGRFPSSVAVAAVVVSRRDMLAEAAAVHGDSDDVRVAFAEQILASHPTMLSGAPRERWIELPGLPDDADLTARLVERAEIYRTAGCDVTLPGDAIRTLQTIADPGALDEILAGGDPGEIAAIIIATRLQRERLAKAVINRADEANPTGVDGFAIVCRLLLDINSRGFGDWANERMHEPSRSLETVAAMTATLLNTRRNAGRPADHGAEHVLLGHLLAANADMVVELCDRTEFSGNPRFIAALPVRHMDDEPIATLAARDDAIGEHVRSSGDLVPEHVMLTWSVPTIKRYPDQWGRLVRIAAGVLQPWQLGLLAGSVESDTPACDAIDVVRTI